MPVNPDFRDLFSELSAVEARYLVVGAHAVIYHATPRYTKDLDIWIEPNPDNAQRVYTALTRFGAPMESLEVEDLATSGTIFQIGIEPNRIDVITELKGLSFEDAWRRRILSTYGDVPVALLGLDDLLVNKRAVGRPQDLMDVESLERVKNSPPPET